MRVPASAATSASTPVSMPGSSRVGVAPAMWRDSVVAVKMVSSLARALALHRRPSESRPRRSSPWRQRGVDQTRSDRRATRLQIAPRDYSHSRARPLCVRASRVEECRPVVVCGWAEQAGSLLCLGSFRARGRRSVHATPTRKKQAEGGRRRNTQPHEYALYHTHPASLSSLVFVSRTSLLKLGRWVWRFQRERPVAAQPPSAAPHEHTTR